MIKINVKKITCLTLVFVFLFSTSAIASQPDDQTTINEPEDIDPLVDLEVTVTIKEIRTLDNDSKLVNNSRCS